ncbi:MAG: hypothetical protein HFJ85_07540 [Oscillospiraceae bacterium]|nr:hypothetical protein [Oscillospiraceae bacterium]
MPPLKSGQQTACFGEFLSIQPEGFFGAAGGSIYTDTTSKAKNFQGVFLYFLAEFFTSPFPLNTWYLSAPIRVRTGQTRSINFVDNSDNDIPRGVFTGFILFRFASLSGLLPQNW